MPYITKDRRFTLYRDPQDFPKNPGELNYLFYSICQEYIRRNRCYQSFNDVTGALENCKLEIYRRMTAQYEDIKREENGDI